MDEKQNDEFEELQIVEDPDYNPPPTIEDHPIIRDDEPPRSLGMIMLGCFLWIILILVVLYGTAILITIFEHIDKAAPLLGATLTVIGFLVLAIGLQNRH